MAEPASLDSNLQILATLTLDSTRSLIKKTQSVAFRPKSVRDLEEELKALGTVLDSLTKVSAITNVDISTLGAPLSQCSAICKEFERQINEQIAQCSDFQWAKLKLKHIGVDINGFKNLLAAHKSTFGIAHSCATLLVCTSPMHAT